MIQNGTRITARKVLNECALECSVRTVQRTMSNIGFKYKKIKKELPLSSAHRKNRMEFAKRMLKLSTSPWQRTVFTDEKRFCKDGPDSEFSCMESEQENFPNRIKRQNRGGGIMVWGAITASGHFKLVKVDGRLNGQKYSDLIIQDIKPWMDEIFNGQEYFFLQDNAAVHKSRLVIEKFKAANINLIDWPSRSPDLNPIENYWKQLSDIVYEQGAYDSDVDLWKSIEKSAQILAERSPNYLNKICNSMNERLLKVLENNGKTLDY